LGRGGQGDAVATAFTEGPPGVYTAGITSRALGVKDVTVTWKNSTPVAPLNPPGQTTVEINPDRYDPAHSGFAVSNFAEVVADGAADHVQTVTVHLGDAWANPISGRAADLSAGAVSVTDPAVHATVADFRPAAAPGDYLADITSTVAGEFKVTVSLVDGTDTESVVARGNDVAVFVPGDPGGRSSLEVDRRTVTVGEVITATAKLIDNEGNPVQATDVTFWTTPAIALPNNGEVTTSPTTGEAVIQITTTRKGDYVLHAEYGTPSVELPGSPTNLTFEPGPPVFRSDRTVLKGTTDDRLANGVSYHTATATVVDEYNNTIVDAAIEFHIGGVGSPAPGYEVTGRTDTSGQVTIRIVSANYLAGTSTVWAEVNSQPITDGTTPEPLTLNQPYITPGVASGSTIAVNPPETSPTRQPRARSPTMSASAPGLGVTWALAAAMADVGRPASSPTRSRRLAAKSNSPRMARSVIAATRSPTPAMAANRSIPSVATRVESTSMTNRRRHRPSARCWLTRGRGFPWGSP
jgi:adhesin/invasin